MKYLLLTSALIFTCSMPLMAQEVVTLPDGHTALNISATDRVEVEQDLLIASLRIQVENKDAKFVQNKINKAMALAVALVKKYPSLKVQTGQYYVHPDYRYIKVPDNNNKRILDKWRGSQTLTIKSQVSEDVLKVTGDIQDMGFVMNGLNYQLSQKKREEVRDALMETTVRKLYNRAKRVAKALGKSNVDIIEINVDANNYSPRPVYAREAKMGMMDSVSSSMTAPSAVAGDTNVSMTINARAIIKP